MSNKNYRNSNSKNNNDNHPPIPSNDCSLQQNQLSSHSASSTSNSTPTLLSPLLNSTYPVNFSFENLSNLSLPATPQKNPATLLLLEQGDDGQTIPISPPKSIVARLTPLGKHRRPSSPSDDLKLHELRKLKLLSDKVNKVTNYTTRVQKKVTLNRKKNNLRRVQLKNKLDNANKNRSMILEERRRIARATSQFILKSGIGGSDLFALPLCFNQSTMSTEEHGKEDDPLQCEKFMQLDDFKKKSLALIDYTNEFKSFEIDDNLNPLANLAKLSIFTSFDKLYDKVKATCIDHLISNQPIKQALIDVFKTELDVQLNSVNNESYGFYAQSLLQSLKDVIKDVHPATTKRKFANLLLVHKHIMHHVKSDLSKINENSSKTPAPVQGKVSMTSPRLDHLKFMEIKSAIPNLNEHHIDPENQKLVSERYMAMAKSTLQEFQRLLLNPNHKLNRLMFVNKFKREFLPLFLLFSYYNHLDLFVETWLCRESVKLEIDYITSMMEIQNIPLPKDIKKTCSAEDNDQHLSSAKDNINRYEYLYSRLIRRSRALNRGIDMLKYKRLLIIDKDNDSEEVKLSKLRQIRYLEVIELRIGINNGRVLLPKRQNFNNNRNLQIRTVTDKSGHIYKYSISTQPSKTVFVSQPQKLTTATATATTRMDTESLSTSSDVDMLIDGNDTPENVRSNPLLNSTCLVMRANSYTSTFWNMASFTKLKLIFGSLKDGYNIINNAGFHVSSNFNPMLAFRNTIGTDLNASDRRKEVIADFVEDELGYPSFCFSFDQWRQFICRLLLKYHVATRRGGCKAVDLKAGGYFDDFVEVLSCSAHASLLYPESSDDDGFMKFLKNCLTKGGGNEDNTIKMLFDVDSIRRWLGLVTYDSGLEMILGQIDELFASYKDSSVWDDTDKMIDLMNLIAPVVETCIYALHIAERKHSNGFLTFFKRISRNRDNNIDFTNDNLFHLVLDLVDSEKFILNLKTFSKNGVVAIDDRLQTYFDGCLKLLNSKDYDLQLPDFLELELTQLTKQTHSDRKSDHRFVFALVRLLKDCIVYGMNQQIILYVAQLESENRVKEIESGLFFLNYSNINDNLNDEFMSVDEDDDEVVKVQDDMEGRVPVLLKIMCDYKDVSSIEPLISDYYFKRLFIRWFSLSEPLTGVRCFGNGNDFVIEIPEPFQVYQIQIRQIVKVKRCLVVVSSFMTILNVKLTQLNCCSNGVSFRRLIDFSTFVRRFYDYCYANIDTGFAKRCFVTDVYLILVGCIISSDSETALIVHEFKKKLEVTEIDSIVNLSLMSDSAGSILYLMNCSIHDLLVLNSFGDYGKGILGQVVEKHRLVNRFQFEFLQGLLNDVVIDGFSNAVELILEFYKEGLALIHSEFKKREVSECQ